MPAPDRLAADVFRLPVERIRSGYYTDAYFNLTKELLEAEDRHPRATMQVFQKRDAVLGGVDEAIAILRECAGREGPAGWSPGWDGLEVYALHEGDEVSRRDRDDDRGRHRCSPTSRRSTSGSGSADTRDGQRPRRGGGGASQPIIFFPARHDHGSSRPATAGRDEAGAIGVSTDAQASWWGGRGVGTVPHGLIAAYGGDTVAAARAFADRYADEMNVTVLVDFANDSVRTSLEVAEALGDRLWGVRLDTWARLVDKALSHREGTGDAHGVTPELAAAVRRALDAGGHPGVRIVASGGFDSAKIREFEALEAPVDSYGVGSSLLRGQNDFTADVVRVDGRECAKVGRRHRPNPRLGRVE